MAQSERADDFSGDIPLSRAGALTDAFHETGAAMGLWPAADPEIVDDPAPVETADVVADAPAAPVADDAPAPTDDPAPPEDTRPAADADQTPPSTDDSEYDVHGNDQAALTAGGAAQAELRRRIGNMEVSALMNESEPNGLGNVQFNVNRTAAAQQATEQKRREDAAKMARKALEDHLRMLDRQIAELQRRADAIEDYLAAGEIEVGPDGRLTDDAMEQELAEYEQRTGQRVDRNDRTAVIQALREQQDYIERTRDGLMTEREQTQRLMDRVDTTGEPPSVEEMRAILPDYTYRELDSASARTDAATAAVMDEARGYDEHEREVNAETSGFLWNDSIPVASADLPVDPVDPGGIDSPEDVEVASADSGEIMPESDEIDTEEGAFRGPVSLAGLEDGPPGQTGGSAQSVEPASVAAQVDGTRLAPIQLSGLFADAAEGETAEPEPANTADNVVVADASAGIAVFGRG
ncbi:MAG: hypothetical protein H6843_00950 [Rhodospirillaceae bacterium]|nr:hypothetical protein [Rhodospirillaceae bacterium]